MKEKAILFGASKMGEKVYELLKDEYDIIFFSDNDENKWGRYIKDKLIIPPKELTNLKNAKVIISSMYRKEIYHQLNEIGIGNINAFYYNLAYEIEKKVCPNADIPKHILKKMSLNLDIIRNESNKNSLVTIGIINYNCSHFLVKCIESAITQTYKNIEIILVDDYSTDNSREVINKYKEDNPNINCIFHESNSGGSSKAIQEIIKNSNGDYFLWIASDDYLREDAIEVFVDFLENNKDIDYVYSNLNIINEFNETIGKYIYNNESVDEMVYSIFNSFGSGFIPMNCLYRKEFFKKNNLSWIIYKGNDYSCDTLNSLIYIKNGWKYRHVNGQYINYRIHSNNLTYNLKRLISGASSIFDYIINNFNEEIYFPNIPWEKIDNREEFKSYVLANFFILQIKRAFAKEVLPVKIRTNINETDIRENIMPLIEGAFYYINKTLELGQNFKDKLSSLQQYLEVM